MISNMFELEPTLKEIGEGIVGVGNVLMDDETNDIDAKLFKSMPDDQRALLAIHYEGFIPVGAQANQRNVLIEIKYRVIIVTPAVDKMAAGAILSQAMAAYSGTVLRTDCKAIELIPDVQEFNQARFGDSLVAVPMLISFKTPLRSK